MLDFETFVDLIGSLAVVYLLATAYGVVRRRLPGVSLAPQLLGAMFGMVAVLQMHAPISPAPGIVVDLRVVPIALAGAFLGGRGALICIIIAAMGRLAIGGVGVASGLAAIFLAGGAGLAWNAITCNQPTRGLRTMLGLGAMTVVTFAAAVLLPLDVMTWFYTSVAPLLLAVYLIVIPAAGTLLERERVLMLNEARLRAVAYGGRDDHFPSRADLERRLAQALASGRLDRGASTLRLHFRPGLAHAAFWGEDNRELVTDALYLRLRGLLPEGAEIGLIAPGHALVVGPSHLALAFDGLAGDIRRKIASLPIHLPGIPPAPAHLFLERADQDHPVDLRALLDPEAASISERVAAPPTDQPENVRLFDVAEHLLALHCDGDRSGPVRRAD
jgi:hypothetical protein